MPTRFLHPRERPYRGGAGSVFVTSVTTPQTTTAAGADLITAGAGLSTQVATMFK